MHVIQCRMQVGLGYFIKWARLAWTGQNMTCLTRPSFNPDSDISKQTFRDFTKNPKLNV